MDVASNRLTHSRRAVHRMACLALLILVLGGLSGCRTSSRKSVRTYDYSNEPRPARGQTGERYREQDSHPPDDEWHMVSPGEMTAPGDMVIDPRRR